MKEIKREYQSHFWTSTSAARISRDDRFVGGQSRSLKYPDACGGVGAIIRKEQA